MTTVDLQQLTRQVRDELVSHKLKIVFAESCTAGRVSATLATLPGISQWLCGSFVVYRNASKAGWLSIPRTLLDDPTVGPVSRQVTGLLAEAALATTPEANMALAITGEIGPGAGDADGQIYTGIQMRGSGGAELYSSQLDAPAPLDASDIEGRIKRLDEATGLAFGQLLEFLRRQEASSVP